MATYMPPGWPAGVHPPGSDDFESTAVGWLLDVVPPDYRLHGVLRRYPIALATMARHHSKACVEGARQGYRTARTELADVLPPHAVDTVLAAYRKEGARLAATARAVGLVERALRGEVFTPKMTPATATGPQAAQPEAAEPRAAQPQAAHPEAAGAKPAGAKATEGRTPGPETAEPEMAGRAGAGRVGAARAGEAQADAARAGEARAGEARAGEARAGEARAGAGGGPAGAVRKRKAT
jgi:hypothetical protein